MGTIPTEEQARSAWKIVGRACAAKRVERTQAGRQIDLTAAEQQGGRRPKAAVGKIVPHDRVEPHEYVHEPRYVLFGSTMDDIQTPSA